MSAPMLEARGLRKAFGDRVAVADVSLSVERGASYGLLGPNGAGKTTTISMLVGIARPDAGTVTLDGRPLDAEAKRNVGFVPQELALYEELTAEDNLRFVASLYGLFGREAERRIGEALEWVGLADRRASAMRTYSGGMKRRLNLAAALLHAPALLVLDEPTVGVDPQSRNAIFEALEGLRERGTTLLYTTHYMEEVERLCERAAIVDEGRVVAEDTIENLYRLVPPRERVEIELHGAWPLPSGEADLLGLKPEGHALVGEMADVGRSLPDVLARLRDLGAPVRGVRTDRTSLEDVFLQLTGRRLRD